MFCACALLGVLFLACVVVWLWTGLYLATGADDLGRPLPGVSEDPAAWPIWIGSMAGMWGLGAGTRAAWQAALPEAHEDRADQLVIAIAVLVAVLFWGAVAIAAVLVGIEVL
ncbi:MAG: hypothetical protein GEU28_13125 [Dehalococcoidia bacterium]|nr:hypothetical protein [Dehalococcoidia bacterium]